MMWRNPLADRADTQGDLARSPLLCTGSVAGLTYPTGKPPATASTDGAL